MKLAEKLVLWADRLRDISAMGLLFSRNPYDKAQFQAVQDIALEILSLAVDEDPAHLEPLRAPVFSRPTPLAVGDGAVIDDAGRILLIQRADNHKWAMPGGALEVGETPAQGVQREVLEETGISCQAVALIGAHDSRLWGTVSRHHLYHFTFLCRPDPGEAIPDPSHAMEILDLGWFEADELPQDIDPGHISRLPQAFRMWQEMGSTFFDK